MHTVLYVKHWGAEQQGSVHAVGNGAWQTEYQEYVHKWLMVSKKQEISLLLITTVEFY